ncbi:hypothetical protein ACQ0MK_05265 [Thalassospira lucentensis]|uniref:hypothetical protein n=1 Tax=Thalassospira lucentensis TaxID=168935 RepID=UPI003D2ED33A
MVASITANIIHKLFPKYLAHAALTAAVAISATLGSIHATTAQETSPVRSQSGILVAAFSIWEPFGIEDEDGTRHGIDVALLTEVANRLDLELHLYACP